MCCRRERQPLFSLLPAVSARRAPADRRGRCPVPDQAGSGGNVPLLQVRWGQQAEVDGPVFASGAAYGAVSEAAFGLNWMNNEPLYGHGPLAQALDVLLALNTVQTARANVVNCVCTAAASGRQALIEVRGA